MTTIKDHPDPWATNLLWLHTLVFSAVALAVYISPQTVFGDSAWLPLPRLAALLFAATLVTTSIVLGGSARSGTRRQIRLALAAALVLDVQMPILIFSQPASLEYLQSGLGIPWFLVPLGLLVMVGLTVHCSLRLRREATQA